MTTSENPTGSFPNLPSQITPHEANPSSLVKLANQLTSESNNNANVTPYQPKKPEVVFVEQQKPEGFSQIIELQIDVKSMAKAEASVAEAAELPFENAQEVARVPLVTETENDLETEQTARFAIDPFLYEIDGTIPVMPTLPIVESDQLTERVIARETSGDHFAWRLVAEPEAIEEAEATEPSISNPIETQAEPEDVWTETEVVAQDDGDAHGDCFFAQPGQVISIDGNQGFDHIDLRSYSIDDATFQTGAILLHSAIDHAAATEIEQSPSPITIRHRGVEFAVFKGEVRVEL
jgi:hypothetical protein